MSLELRELRMNDCQSAGEIVGQNAIWRDTYHYSAEAAARDLLYGASHGDYVLGAFDKTLIGFAWILPKGGFGRSPYLRLIAVSPNAQSRGIGAQLLDRAEADFKKTAKHLFLMVSDFNARAQAFYAARGYNRVGNVPGFVLATVDEQVWMKTL
ncbi:MAG: GNAT family N-acetyltransferase [Deltaproteobacteria bacterium]|nr:GNAT family N-acetyltransferase [Deltaproteobacteria bacterium]